MGHQNVPRSSICVQVFVIHIYVELQVFFSLVKLLDKFSLEDDEDDDDD